MVADLGGDGFEFFVGGFEEFLGFLNAHVGDVLHGGATEFAQAETAQVFGADVGLLGEGVEFPVDGEVAGDELPEFGNAGAAAPWGDEASNVTVDEAEPVMDLGGVFVAEPFGAQALDHASEVLGTLGEPERGGGADERFGPWGFFVADPGEGPFLGWFGMEGVEDAGWGEAEGTGFDAFPVALKEHAAFAFEAGEEEAAGGSESDTAVRREGVVDAESGDAMGGEFAAVVSLQGPALGAWSVDGDFLGGKDGIFFHGDGLQCVIASRFGEAQRCRVFLGVGAEEL